MNRPPTLHLPPHTEDLFSVSLLDGEGESKHLFWLRDERTAFRCAQAMNELLCKFDLPFAAQLITTTTIRRQ